ncbi:WD40 repeat-like protein [Laetiporus sulphureus 93-53]|uniref:WD40 repeat-like protein n=1 Tax=Laetiporus sulphureus 93-53 TaxID=1314785 RepID=A0A165BPQ7_9APHY|nr:WD40 repeat-like protein [Laetiporus sulphureus 93-53]KZT01432.1 WD40 repeat-like protein [Laetiporus sulphureus 93-53]
MARCFFQEVARRFRINFSLLTLPSGDDGIVIVWAVKSSKKIQEISCFFCGAITAVCWIDPRCDKDLSFALGCASGDIQVYLRSDANATFQLASMRACHEAHVEDIRFDSNSRRVASVGGGAVQVWNLTLGYSLESLVKDPPRQAVTVRSVHFCDEGASVIVCFCESHDIFCYNVEPWTLKWAKRVPTRIGHSALSHDERTLVISNLETGVDEYRFPSLERVRSYTYPILRNHIMQVGMIGTQIIVGGDDGFARMYESTTGCLIGTLDHYNGVFDSMFWPFNPYTLEISQQGPLCRLLL